MKRAEHDPGPYRISELARLADVNVETVRYYERRGLLPEPPRRTAQHHRGYRLYADEHLHRLRFIRQAKELGFSLKEVQELLDLRLDGERACDEVRSLAEVKFADIEGKIDMLQNMRQTLGKLILACTKHKRTEGCPILGAIEGEKRR
ncbi:MAG: MerR family transcriptional regulator [Candidatus Hydrogenedentes bacterium]|nr:MerR family transcriptional regulator [Candidatus Hydrogenedentota bacterium]